MKKITSSIVRSLHRPLSTSHKGMNGLLTVIGGSPRYHGAPLLSIIAASRFVDFVFYYSPAVLNKQVLAESKAKELCCIFLKKSELAATIDESDCVLLGNGMELNASNKRLIDSLLEKFPGKKFVLDAGALRMVDKRLLNENILVTPHIQEFKALFGVKASPSEALKQASKHGCIVMLKQNHCFVTDGREVFFNANGNAGMTKGGTGDVLAGVAAALACKNSLLDAAKAAAFLNGAVADSLFAKRSFAFSALDLADSIPLVYGKFAKR